MNNQEEPTLEEIWSARQQIWKENGESFAGLLSFYQEKQKQHIEKLVSLELDEPISV